MLNVMRSEFYKVSRRKYPYLLIGITCLLELMLLGIFVLSNRHHTSNFVVYEHVIPILVMAFSAGLYFTLPIVDMVFSDEYKNLTLKNSVSFGTSRASIYFGKLFVQLIVAFISLVAMLAVIGGGAYLLLGVENSARALELTKFLLTRTAAALPLWIAGLCIVNMLAFMVKSSALYTVTFIGMIMLVPNLVKLLSVIVSPVFNKVYDWLLTTQFDVMVASTSALSSTQIGKIAIISATCIVASCLAGYLTFRRKEIK